jgi:hypothetical protein
MAILRLEGRPMVLLSSSVTIGGVPVSTGHSAIEEHAEHGRSLVKTTVNNQLPTTATSLSRPN